MMGLRSLDLVYYSMAMVCGLVALSVSVILIPCISNQLFRGSSDGFTLNTADTNPPINATGCCISSFTIGFSSSKNMVLSSLFSAILALFS